MNAETDLISGSACTPSSSSNGCTDIPLAATNGTTDYYIVVWVQETNSDQSTPSSLKVWKLNNDNSNGQ